MVKHFTSHTQWRQVAKLAGYTLNFTVDTSTAYEGKARVGYYDMNADKGVLAESPAGLQDYLSPSEGEIKREYTFWGWANGWSQEEAKEKFAKVRSWPDLMRFPIGRNEELYYSRLHKIYYKMDSS